MDWLDVTHRVLDGRGNCRGFVLKHGRGDHRSLRITVDDYGARERFFESMRRLEGYVRQRRWTLKGVNHFDEG